MRLTYSFRFVARRREMYKPYHILVFLMATACGGGGGESVGSGIDPRLARIDIYETQRVRVLGDPGAGVMGMMATPDPAIPTSGQAHFDGFVTMRVENPAQVLVLYGDSAIAVDFAGNTVTGTLDNFFGTTGRGNVADYAGEVTIDGGTLRDGVSIDYSGVLTAGSDRLVLGGTADGQFLNQPVSAIAVTDLEAGVIHNGTLFDATLIIVGEGSVTP